MVSDPFATAVCTLVEENLAAFRAIAVELGDDRINIVPALPGANPPFGIVAHCVGMTKFWLGSVVGGERIPRDRAAEFTASGTVADLEAAIDDIAGRVPAWVHIARTEGVRDRDVEGSTRASDIADASPEWVLLHVLRELAQHLGQLELTRDMIIARTRRQHGALGFGS